MQTHADWTNRTICEETLKVSPSTCTPTPQGSSLSATLDVHDIHEHEWPLTSSAALDAVHDIHESKWLTTPRVSEKSAHWEEMRTPIGAPRSLQVPVPSSWSTPLDQPPAGPGPWALPYTDYENHPGEILKVPRFTRENVTMPPNLVTHK